MKPFRIFVLSAGLLLSALLGCSEPDPGETSRPAHSAQSPIPGPTTGATSSAVPPEVIDMAKADLARLLHIEADQISLVEAIPTVWRDASLGCPKPGIDYVRVETPGYRLLLQAEGQVYTYHSDQARRVIRCSR